MFIYNLILKLVEVYNLLINPYKTKIQKVHLTYIHDGSANNKKLNRFWTRESAYWLQRGKDEDCWCDISNEYKNKRILKVPKHVKNVIFKIKYLYSGCKYTCVNIVPEINEEKTEARFTLPIKNVELKSSQDETICINVTKKYNKYLGPKKNFHNCGNKIKVNDLFYYSDYDNICITNILGQIKTFNSDTFIHLLL